MYQQPEPNHTWIFILLLCGIMLIVGVFGFALFQIYSGEEEVAQEELLPEPSQSPETNNTPTEVTNPEPTTVSYNELYPSFSVPLGWNVTVNTGGSDDIYITNILMNKGVIRVCDDCGDNSIPVLVTHYRPDFPTPPTAELLKQGFADPVTGALPVNFQESTETLANGTLYIASGNTPEDQSPSHFEELVLFAGQDGTIVYIQYNESAGGSTLREDWNLILSTFTF